MQVSLKQNNIVKSISMTTLDQYQLEFIQETSGDFYMVAMDRFGLMVRHPGSDEPRKIRQFILLNNNSGILNQLPALKDSIEQSILSRELLSAEFNRQTINGRRLDIMLSWRDNEPVIVCGVGLHGGDVWGRVCGIAAGVGLFGLGVVCIVSTVAVTGPVALIAYSVGGGALTGAGISSTIYTATTEEKNFNSGGFVKQAVIGAVSGAITGGASGGTTAIAQKLALEGIKKLGTTVVIDAAGSAVGTVASTYTEAKLETDEKKKAEIHGKLTLNKLAVGVVTSVVSSQASQLLSNGANKLASKATQACLNQTDDVALLATQPMLQAMSKNTKVAVQAVVGGGVGAAVGGAAKVASNCLNGEEDIWKEVKESAVIGAISGSIINMARAAKAYQADRQQLDIKVDQYKEKIQMNAALFNELDQLPSQWFDDGSDDFEKTKLKLKNNQCDLDEIIQIAEKIAAVKAKHKLPTVSEQPDLPEQPKQAPVSSGVVEPTKELADAEKNSQKKPEVAPPQAMANLPQKQSVKIYYIRRPLKRFGGDTVAMLDSRAAHAGILIDDPQQGLIRLEIEKDGSYSKVVTKKVEKFDRTTGSNKGRWSYAVGETNFSLKEMIDQAMRWLCNHPEYEYNGDNCRAFTDAMLRYFFQDGHGQFLSQDQSSNHTELNRNRFFQGPCREIEHRIKDHGFNTSNPIVHSPQ